MSYGREKIELFSNRWQYPVFSSLPIIQKRDQREPGTQTADILDLNLQCELMTSTPRLYSFQGLLLNTGFRRPGRGSLESFLGSWRAARDPFVQQSPRNGESLEGQQAQPDRPSRDSRAGPTTRWQEGDLRVLAGGQRWRGSGSISFGCGEVDR